MNSKFKDNDNPMAIEDGSIVGKIKSKFKKDKQEINEEDEELNTIGSVKADFICMNDFIPICAEACACCWDKKVPEGYQEQAEYIAKRTRMGHTSVIEHSNFVVLVTTPKKFVNELVEFLDSCNYLNHRTIIDNRNNNTTYYTILGGSFRGYSDIYKEISNLKNPILQAITQVLYIYSHSAMFEDLGQLGLMDLSGFMNTDPHPDDEDYRIIVNREAIKLPEADNEYFKIIGIDKVEEFYTNLYEVNRYVGDAIGLFDAFKFTTITVLFKDMGRTCTHQLVRHRNAITQESQRYVDYSSAAFSNPATFKPDKYDTDHEYTIRFGSGPNQKMTLQDLGDELCGIYKQLTTENKGYELLKEDARSYLPSNVKCRKIYITFTYKNLLKFLELREHTSAQAEIRAYALKLGEYVRSVSSWLKNDDKDYAYGFNKPRLIVEDPFKFDIEEDINDEQNEPIIEDWYISALADDYKEDDN